MTIARKSKGMNMPRLKPGSDVYIEGEGPASVVLWGDELSVRKMTGVHYVLSTLDNQLVYHLKEDVEPEPIPEGIYVFDTSLRQDGTVHPNATLYRRYNDRWYNSGNDEFTPHDTALLDRKHEANGLVRLEG